MVGVPLISPEAGSIVSPRNESGDELHCRGGTSPVAWNWNEYARPTIAGGVWAGASTSLGFTRMVNACCLVTGGDSESCTLSVKFEVPVVEGDPLNVTVEVPLPAMEMPGGSAPPVTLTR
jgi:hypothetical protein